MNAYLAENGVVPNETIAMSLADIYFYLISRRPANTLNPSLIVLQNLPCQSIISQLWLGASNNSAV